MAYATPAPMDEGENHPDFKDRASRLEAAVALRIHGASYSEIARTLGYTTAHNARLAVERGLANTVGTESRDQQRFIEARRLERLLRSVYGRATDENDPEHLGYVRTALALIDRHAKLYGLDAPAEVILYNPTAREIQEWINTKAALTSQGFPEEADIIHGEIIESDLGDDG